MDYAISAGNVRLGPEQASFPPSCVPFLILSSCVCVMEIQAGGQTDGEEERELNSYK